MLRRIAELRDGEETSRMQQLECERDTWEVERGLQVKIASHKEAFVSYPVIADL